MCSDATCTLTAADRLPLGEDWRRTCLGRQLIVAVRPICHCTIRQPVAKACFSRVSLASIGLDVLFAYRDTNSTQFTTCITESGGATAHITSFSPNCYCFVQHCSSLVDSSVMTGLSMRFAFSSRIVRLISCAATMGLSNINGMSRLKPGQ